jgi:hypothetical protein
MRLLVALFLLSGCASADDLRVVHPVSWHELNAVELGEMCEDYSSGIRGCVISRAEGDAIYVRSCKP